MPKNKSKDAVEPIVEPSTPIVAAHRERSHSGSSHHSHSSHKESPRPQVQPISIFNNVTVSPTTTQATNAKDASSGDGCTSCFTALFQALKH